jgi:hypothetical protein
MSVDRLSIKPNDDGTFQIECYYKAKETKEDVPCAMGDSESASAKDIDELVTKVKEMISEKKEDDSKTSRKEMVKEMIEE